MEAAVETPSIWSKSKQWKIRCSDPHFGLCLAALAEFDEPKRSTFVMFGVLTIAVRIYHDRWGYGVYSGPIGTAVLVITVKWVSKKPAGHFTWAKIHFWTESCKVLSTTSVPCKPWGLLVPTSQPTIKEQIGSFPVKLSSDREDTAGGIIFFSKPKFAAHYDTGAGFRREMELFCVQWKRKAGK